MLRTTLGSEMELFERRSEMNAIAKALSRSFLVVIGLVAVAVPISAQSPTISFSVLPQSPTIALLGAVSNNFPADTGNLSKSVAPAAPSLRSESLSTSTTKFALTPAIKGWDQLTADEKETFGQQMKASAVRWNTPELRNSTSGGELAKSNGKRVLFVSRGLQPGQH
jgi:hypothetical protein